MERGSLYFQKQNRLINSYLYSMLIAELPATARVWIYQSSREFTPEEMNWLNETCHSFMQGWASHGKALHAGYEIKHNRFLIISVDEESAAASGCSIDKSVHLVKEIENTLGISLTGRMEIAYLDETGNVATAKLPELAKLISEGKMKKSTKFFNNLVATRADMEKDWVTTIEGSWVERFI